MKISFCKKDIDQLIKLSEEKNIFLEGNIVKVIETDSEIFKDYILKAKEKDDTARKKRLEITRQVQDQNKLLEKKANLLGILLTNSFSIVGTIMGVKYANDKKEE